MKCVFGNILSKINTDLCILSIELVLLQTFIFSLRFYLFIFAVSEAITCFLP